MPRVFVIVVKIQLA